ncbi:MAG: hypothetical protein Q4D02_05320 [Clostridia bacterium]|nr:hypothetical protein [Clostridia bacterium]
MNNITFTRPDLSTSVPISSLPTPVSYYIRIAIYLIIFIIGLLFVLKRIGNNASKALKIISYIIPIVGIILYFMNVKKDKTIALDYLKSGIAGVMIYLLIFIVFYIFFLVRVYVITTH